MKWWCFCLALVLVQWPTLNAMPSADNGSGSASHPASPDADDQETPATQFPQSDGNQDAPEASPPQPELQQAQQALTTQLPQASRQQPNVALPEDDSQDVETDNSDNELGVSGNWIKKKDIVLQAYDLYDEINAISIEIQGARQKFNVAYSSIDNDLDAFYKKFGVEQGKIQELFSSILTHLEHKKKKKQDELSKQRGANAIKERDYIINAGILEEEIAKHEKSLDQLKLDLKSIEELDKSLTDRLKKLNEVTNQAMQITAGSKMKIEKLWDILDHNKARTIYFEIKGNDLEKIKNINTYLNNDLFQDFQKVSETIRTQIGSVETRTTELEKAGFFIKNRAEQVALARTLKVAKTAEDAVKSAQAPVKKQIEIQKNWYERIYDSIITAIADVIYYFKNLFSSQPTAMAVKHSRPTQAQPIAIMPLQPAQPAAFQPQMPVTAQPMPMQNIATQPQGTTGMPMAAVDNADDSADDGE